MELNQSLKVLTQNYLDAHPSLSLNALAKRANVSEPTLRRLMNDTSKQAPSPNIVLNLVSYIFKEKKLSVLLSKTDGAIGEFLRKSYDQFIFDQETYEYHHDLNALFRDKDYYLIYKLAANTSGIKPAEIEKMLGEIGKMKINELMKKKVLIKDEEGTLHAANKNFSVDIQVAKDFLPEMLRFFKPEKAEEGKNLFYTLSESLNDEAIQQIKNIQREAVKNIHKIMSDEQNQGEIPYFAVTLLDTMTF